MDQTSKRQRIAAEAVRQAGNVLAAADQLAECARLLVQSGGNFLDTDLATATYGVTPQGGALRLDYLTAYQINVCLQSLAPALTAWLDGHLGGDPAAATNREYLEQIVGGPY